MTTAGTAASKSLDNLSWGKRGTAGAVFAGDVQCENVSFQAGGKLILDGISLTLQAGQIASLLGPSGCGKSTLLRLIAGVLRPTSGVMRIGGSTVAGPGKFVPPEQRSVGLMFQDYALFPHMTALQNVAYGLTALGREEARDVALRALERVGLLAAAERYPANLSGGEQQRVALARAIVPRPQVLLMDEPFSGLDQRLRDSVREETLAVVRETKATCLLVTHDPREAMAFTDQIYLMRTGRIVQEGSVATLLDSPADAEVASFFRSYNRFRGKVVAGKIDTPLGSFAAKGFDDGAEVIVLVPPDAIRPVTSGGQIEGRVLENRYMGDGWLLHIAIAGADRPVEVMSSSGEVLIAGNSCSLVIDHRRTQLFAASS